MQEEGQETHTQVCRPCPRPLACSAECGQRLRHPQIDAYDQRDALFKVKGCRAAAANPSIDRQTLPASPSIALTFLQHLLLVICVNANIKALTITSKLPSTPMLMCEPWSQVAWAGSPRCSSPHWPGDLTNINTFCIAFSSVGWR